MSIEGLVGLVVMLISTVVVIGLPFVTNRNTVRNMQKRELEMTRDELLAAYERVLSTLRDLEDDYKSHKIHPADYEQEREYWSQYGVRLLQLLDGETVTEEDIDNHDMHMDRNVEEAIQNYRVALQSVEKA